ncbi:MAG: Protein trl tRNA-associated locus protein [Moraxellaceae bacterium]|jgi:hypothetical protein|nr:Protein trl tRNA-associated locus protein [Moraxellaceae bacterium]
MNLLKLVMLGTLALGISGCMGPMTGTKLVGGRPTAPVWHYGAYVEGPAPSALSFYAAPIDVGPAAIAQPSKRGEACMQNILGIVAVGDASIDTAKRNGGITQVASVEQHPTRVLTYYARFCTVVRGE